MTPVDEDAGSRASAFSSHFNSVKKAYLKMECIPKLEMAWSSGWRHGTKRILSIMLGLLDWTCCWFANGWKRVVGRCYGLKSKRMNREDVEREGEGEGSRSVYMLRETVLPLDPVRPVPQRIYCRPR